ncbi:MAG: caspase family protein [Bacteroidales bacterium]|jgi:hypothetical protein|nr:caspase family protein [Bacteroidales bacterium]
MRKALIVGINNYPSAPLKGCINDASGIASLLERHGNGSPNFDIKLITDIQNKSQLMELITQLFAGDCETALFFFSGHGYINEVGGYLVTPDHEKYDVGISMDELLTIVNQSAIKDKIIILDCCFSGTMGSSKTSGGVCQIQSGVSILTASRDNETSIEINNHGLFTALLIDALQGGAADLRGNISPGGIYSYIDQALGPWDQRPVFKTNVTRFTSLREITPQVSVDTIRKLIDYFKSPTDELKLDPSFEYTNSPDDKHNIIKPYANPENVAIFKELQKLEGVGLVIPVDTAHMYFAAMESKSCKLTSLGYHYWRLVKDKRI